MSESEGRTSEASRITAAYADTRMEVGQAWHGFHHRITQDPIGYDSIWVVVDHLNKVAHFIPVKTTYTSAKLAKIYMTRIVCLHGVSRTIVSDRGTQFTSKFWHQLHQTLGTRLEFSTAFHPHIDGQTERVNQILEDMLRACALDYGSSWDDNLPYAEFS